MSRRNNKSTNNTNNPSTKPKTPPNSTKVNPNSSKVSLIPKTKSPNSRASNENTSIAINKLEPPIKKIPNKPAFSTLKTNVKLEKWPSTESLSTKTSPNKTSKS
jgi:hypothetical protein